jgi:hypothetical protein
MNKIVTLFSISIIFAFLVFSPYLHAQEPAIDGDYKIGDTKCTIKSIDPGKFRVYWNGVKGASKLEYKEDIFDTGEQIWIEKIKGKVVGNFIMHTGYASGRYVRFADDYHAAVIRIY